MWTTYVTLAYRNLLKYKGPTFINIFGLSVALGCSIVAFLFVHSVLLRDTAHEHAAHIFMVEHLTTENGEVQAWGTTPAPLGPALAADFPQVVRSVRVADASGRVQVTGSETAFDEWVRYVDPGFFDMFTFPLVSGRPDALQNPDAVILSEATARRFFGEEDPMGRSLTVTIGPEAPVTFTVQGVAAAFPGNAGVQFRILTAYANRPGTAADRSADWSVSTAATFVQVGAPADVDVLAGQMERYVAAHNAATEGQPIVAYAFDNLLDLTRNADRVRNTIAGQVPWAPVIALSAIATFLLVLSCINYMNIALATARRRFKEIGVRKVMGSHSLQLVAQFLSENILLCLISLVLGVGVAYGFLLPAFNDIAGMGLSMDLSGSLGLWVFLAGLLVGVGLASGAYPAFYMASFQPVLLLKGEQKTGRRRLFMQGYLTVQFVLAFITVIAAVVLIQNGIDQTRRDWGYDREHTLVIPLAENSPFSVWQSEILQLPDVVSISGSQHHLGRSWSRADVTVDAETMEATIFDVGPSYLETLGLRLKTGQFFDRELVGASTPALVVNETFARARGWTAPVGQSVRIDSTEYTVIGVAEDFHYSDFSGAIQPALFRLTDASQYRYVSLRVEAGAGARTAAALETIWHRLRPETPAAFFFQDTVFDAFYREIRGISRIFVFTACMALLIACLGLFGLAAQNTAARMKEISIRKVLGASVFHVTRLVNRRFLVLLVLAAGLATPVSFVLLQALLDSIYRYHQGIRPSALVIAYALVFTTAAVTVATQLRRLVTANPAEELRTE